MLKKIIFTATLLLPLHSLASYVDCEDSFSVMAVEHVTTLLKKSGHTDISINCRPSQAFSNYKNDSQVDKYNYELCLNKGAAIAQLSSATGNGYSGTSGGGTNGTHYRVVNMLLNELYNKAPKDFTAFETQSYEILRVKPGPLSPDYYQKNFDEYQKAKEQLLENYMLNGDTQSWSADTLTIQSVQSPNSIK